MKATFRVTVEEHSADFSSRIREYTELEGVTEDEAHTRAEDVMHTVVEQADPSSNYRITVVRCDEHGEWVSEALWAKRQHD